MKQVHEARETETSTPYNLPTDGLQLTKQEQEDVILAQARQILRSRVLAEPLAEPRQAGLYLQLLTHGLKHEVFGILHLNTQNMLIHNEQIEGTLSQVSIYPREVVRSCLERGTSSVIIYHNHTSGFSEPSQADIKLTTKLKQALELVDVRIVDHLVVSDGGFYSFAEKGML